MPATRGMDGGDECQMDFKGCAELTTYDNTDSSLWVLRACWIDLVVDTTRESIGTLFAKHINALPVDLHTGTSTKVHRGWQTRQMRHITCHSVSVCVPKYVFPLPIIRPMSFIYV